MMSDKKLFIDLALEENMKGTDRARPLTRIDGKISSSRLMRKRVYVTSSYSSRICMAN